MPAAGLQPASTTVSIAAKAARTAPTTAGMKRKQSLPAIHRTQRSGTTARRLLRPRIGRVNARDRPASPSVTPSGRSFRSTRYATLPALTVRPTCGVTRAAISSRVWRPSTALATRYSKRETATTPPSRRRSRCCD